MDIRRHGGFVALLALVLAVLDPAALTAQERDASAHRSRFTIHAGQGYVGIEAQFGGRWRVAPEVLRIPNGMAGSAFVVRAFQSEGPLGVTLLLGGGAGGWVTASGDAPVPFLSTRVGLELPLFWSRAGLRIEVRGVHGGGVRGHGLQLGVRLW